MRTSSAASTTSERLGRLHVTTRRALSYVEVPDGRVGASDREAVLMAPLHSHGGRLVGVLCHGRPGRTSTSSRRAPATSSSCTPTRRDFALDLLHERHVLVEHLRLSDAAQSMLYDAVAQPDVSAAAGVASGRVSPR